MSSFKITLVRFFSELKPDALQQYLMSIGASVGLIISVVLGGIDKMIWALFILAVADYILGTLAAFHGGEWDSNTGFRGIGKKCIIFAFVGIAVGVDYTLGSGQTFRQIIIGAYGVNEAGSIIENIDKLGFGHIIPAAIRNGLARLKATSEKGEGAKWL